MRAAVFMAALALAAAAQAQTKSAADGIAEYRAMLANGNPAELFEAKGEALWQTTRGPKNTTLQACDLGKGAGVVKGAFVELPRWFADTGRVQDLESRLLTCMERLQGFDAAEIARRPCVRGIVRSLVVRLVAALGDSELIRADQRNDLRARHNDAGFGDNETHSTRQRGT